MFLNLSHNSVRYYPFLYNEKPCLRVDSVYRYSRARFIRFQNIIIIISKIRNAHLDNSILYEFCNVYLRRDERKIYNTYFLVLRLLS